jgi:hypothetical protein
MTLVWSKSNGPKHPQARDIKRDCGHPWLATADSANGPSSQETEAP